MTAIYHDSPLTDDERRERLYAGQLFVFPPRPSTLALCALARELLDAAFAPYDPRLAQFSLPEATFAAIATDVQPAFNHHPRAQSGIRALLQEFGCDLAETCFVTPQLRIATSLRRRVATTALSPHRDTWYSAPRCQLNWWLPIYDITPENGLALHPRYWDQPLRNGTCDYDVEEWTEPATSALVEEQVRAGQRRTPAPEEPVELEPELRPVCPAGGLILFSSAHLHSTVPNRSPLTRFSFDFRTVHLADVRADRGAPNVDSAARGSALRYFRRAVDLSPVPAEIVAHHAGRAATTLAPAYGDLLAELRVAARGRLAPAATTQAAPAGGARSAVRSDAGTRPRPSQGGHE